MVKCSSSSRGHSILIWKNITRVSVVESRDSGVQID